MANEVVVHVKAEGHPDRDIDRMGNKATATAKRSFAKTGGHAGAAFAAGFIKTMTFGRSAAGSPGCGQDGPEDGPHRWASGCRPRCRPGYEGCERSRGRCCRWPWAPLLVAGPVAFLVKGMLKAEEEAKKAAPGGLAPQAIRGRQRQGCKEAAEG